MRIRKRIRIRIRIRGKIIKGERDSKNSIRRISIGNKIFFSFGTTFE